MTIEHSALNLKLPTLSDLYDFDIDDVAWDIENLIPNEAVTVVQGPGGIRKTWLLLQMGSAIADGKKFCGLETTQKPVIFVDFENPIMEICRRAKILGRSDLQMWHLTHEPKPPRLDAENWEVYKAFSPSVIIFDSLRASHYLDENSSKDMTIIMSKLKELRSVGHTVIGILHTTKSDARIHRGSSAIIDQCDHVLGLTQVKRIGSDESIEDDFDEDLPFRLGHIQKTRFIPFKIYLRFDPNSGFSVTSSPDDEALKTLYQVLINYSKAHPDPSQKVFIEIIRTELDTGRDRTLSLIKKGEGVYWRSFLRKSANNQRIYTPILTGE